MRSFWLLAGLAAAACSTPAPVETSAAETRSCDYVASEFTRAEVDERFRAGIAGRTALAEQSRSFVEPERVVTVPPAFPSRALACAIDGDCYIAFDISSDGRPENIMPACSERMFDRAARQTIERFEYTPLMVDGEAVASPDHMTVLRFRLAE